MVNPCSSILICISLLGSVHASAVKGRPDADQRNIAQLERQLSVLRESYSLARSDAQTARNELREIRSRLEALGGTALGNSEERLIETIAQLESTRNELEQVRKCAYQLSSSIDQYTKNALVEDAQATLQLETARCELELALGLRQAPSNELAGTLQDATVLSIDAESGLIVINAGRAANVNVGMPMEISRGDQAIVRAMVTDVRKQVAGLLVQKRINPALAVKVGDHVSVITKD